MVGSHYNCHVKNKMSRMNAMSESFLPLVCNRICTQTYSRVSGRMCVCEYIRLSMSSRRTTADFSN